MKSVFITGAAAGIGLATARRFASQGYFIGLYDVNQQALQSALGSSDFPDACSGFCDVTSRESILAAMEEFASHTQGKMDILVNNAGVLSAGAFSEINGSAHDLMIDVNVKGLTRVAEAGFPYLKATPGACMVNLCSASSIHGVPNLAVYSATKFYVNGLTQALYLEWRSHDIRVCCVKPDLVDTPMAHDVQAQAASSRAIDLKPEDIAEVIAKAVHGTRISYVIGKAARIWAPLDKFLPEALRARLTGRLIGRK